MTNYEERPTQEDRILNLLYENKWKYVSALDIVKSLWILQYSARIFWLRNKWFIIKNKVEMKKNFAWDSVKIGSFTLEDAYKCEDCWKIMNEKMSAPFNWFNDYNQCLECNEK